MFPFQESIGMDKVNLNLVFINFISTFLKHFKAPGNLLIVRGIILVIYYDFHFGCACVLINEH